MEQKFREDGGSVECKVPVQNPQRREEMEIHTDWLTR